MKAPLAALAAPLLLSLAPAATPATAWTQDEGPSPEFLEDLAALEYLEGRVTVDGDLASIDLPEGWSYLEASDARWVVERAWGNPPDDTVLGLVVPPSGFFDWAIIVYFEEEGYVDDADAADMDYDELLASMQADAEEANGLRAEAGYESIEIVRWAEPPHYDSAGKKLYWAKELRFGGAPETTLNYDIRILGRRGYLTLQAVADQDDLAAVTAGVQELLPGTEFLEGHRYADFDSSVDEIAAYGIGGLIAGKVLLKGGLLAKLGLLLAKGWKLIAVAVVVAGSFLKRLLGRSEPTPE